jgi:hypothetical protein
MLKILNVRKKPIVVQAVLITPDNMEELAVAFDTVNTFTSRDNTLLTVSTLEGNYQACPGNYLMIGIEGEVYPIQGDIFNKNYDVVEV